MRSPFAAPAGARPDALALATAVAAVAWALAIAAYAVGFYASGAQTPLGGLAALLFLMAALAPGAMLGVALALLRRAEALAAPVAPAPPQPMAADAPLALELRALRERLAAIEARLAERPTPPPEAPAQPPRAQVHAPAHAPRSAPPAPPPPAQPALPFVEAEPEAAPLSWAEIARALDFPRDARDVEGFAALKAALRDPELAQLLQAAEDVLTMLAAEGLHMEDMAPEPATLADWRAYAEGARGPAAAAIGGLRDAAALERVRARQARDAIFRDAALVLARRWGVFVQRVFRDGGDAPPMLRLAESRTGRAFMLVARASGAFD